MSKTDKHVPFRVQVMRNAVPCHDHAGRDCDLRPVGQDPTQLSPKNRGCFWTIPESMWGEGLFSRYKGEGEFIQRTRNRKVRDRRRDIRDSQQD